MVCCIIYHVFYWGRLGSKALLAIHPQLLGYFQMKGTVRLKGRVVIQRWEESDDFRPGFLARVDDSYVCVCIYE